MAIVANTYTRYGAQGLREQLADIIYDISPEDTPVLSGAGRTSINQTLFEWQTDALEAPDDDNAHLEGDDIAAFPAVTPTARVGNYTQISRKLVLISDTLEAVDKAGRRSEMAKQISMRGSELKRDLETIILSNQGGDAGGTATPRRTATLAAWLKTNTNFATGDGADPTYTAGVPGDARTDGTQRAFTETILKDVLQQIWTSGGSAKVLMTGPVNKNVASSFPGIATRNYDLSNVSPKATAVIGSVDVYVGEFDVVKIIPNRFQRERDAWVLDMEYIEVGYLRPFATKKLAKTGDAEKRMLLAEWGLKVNQEAALGAAFDLTTTA